MLVIMADLLSISVGKQFLAAVIPGLLTCVYLYYLYLWRTKFNPKLAPALSDDVKKNKDGTVGAWFLDLFYLRYF